MDEPVVVTLDAPGAVPAKCAVLTPELLGCTYLVSATGGQVSACGFSGAATPELTQLYDLAFR